MQQIKLNRNYKDRLFRLAFQEKKDLLESLELYYRVFFLGEEVPEEAFAEEDGEKPDGK